MKEEAKQIPGGGLYANIFCSFIILAVNREDWLIGFIFVEFSINVSRKMIQAWGDAPGAQMAGARGETH